MDSRERSGEKKRKKEEEGEERAKTPDEKEKKNSTLPTSKKKTFFFQGFHDRAYKLRRAELAELAKTHVPGTPPPLVSYSKEETAVWSEVFDEVSRLYPLAACPEFLRSLPALGFSRAEVPQLRDVSETLERATGWRVRPVAGLMHPRDFLAGLAFRTFHSTQYLRHGSRPSYTPVS